jgi:hypothetical protein
MATNVASGSASVQQAGTWSNSITFTIITPTISSISPSSGVPGTQVTINGTNFGATQGSGQVWLGSTYAGSIVSWSNTQIVATVAANSTSGNAQVQQSGVWGNQVAFTVTSPSITSVSPTTARAGDSITITGSNFGATQGSGQMWLGSKLAGSYVSWSNTQIVATVASGATSGSAQVKQSGVWGNSVAFTVITPVITNVSPGTARAGDSITITGPASDRRRDRAAFGSAANSLAARELERYADRGHRRLGIRDRHRAGAAGRRVGQLRHVHGDHAGAEQHLADERPCRHAGHLYRHRLRHDAGQRQSVAREQSTRRS